MLRAPVALGFAQRRQRVGGFAGLRDDDRRACSADDRVAIAVLGAVVDLDRQAGELLDEELADEAGVPGRAAGQNRDPLDRARARRR